MPLSNTRLVFVNYARIGNGVTTPSIYTTISTPASDASYPPVNLLNADRYTPWIYPGSGSASIYVYMGSTAVTINSLGLLDYELLTSGTAPTGMNVYTSTDGTTFTPTTPGTFTLANNTNLTINAVSAKYVLFQFNGVPTARFKVGSLLIGEAPALANFAARPVGLNFGTTHAGREVTVQRTRTIMHTLSGLPVITDFGNPARAFVIHMTSWGGTYVDTIRAAMDVLIAQSGSIAYFDENDKLWEVVPSNNAVRYSLRAFNIYDVDIALDELP